MSKWLITGSGGMLGRDLVSLLGARGEAVTALAHRDLDVTDQDAVGAAFRRYTPDIVVNCAAWTAVDEAESNESQALLINGHGPAILATCCAATGIKLVQVSTDYVFDGQAREPYAEDDVAAPCSAYGRTKLAGERVVRELLPRSGYVVRTSWLYGAHGPNFVRTMIRLERQRPHLDVVDDQRGQPTWTMVVADRIIALIKSGAAPGNYHATSSGETTWFGLAREVFRLLEADPTRVRPTTSTALARPAPRPAYSVLGHDSWARVGLAAPDDWQQALGRAFPALASMQSDENGN